MRADNTTHLKKAAATRHENTRQRAIDALDHLQSTGSVLTVAGLARSAGVARSWIYTQPDLLDRINAQQRSTRAAANPRTCASEESWQRRIELAHQRIKELTEENQQLRTQLAVAHGQRRAGQITASRTPSTTQNP
jgi:alanyl-tRNA synthetase